MMFLLMCWVPKILETVAIDTFWKRCSHIST
jgi:hypothetical protein